MKVSLHLTGGGVLHWEHMPTEDAAALRDDLMDRTVPVFLQLAMDGDTILVGTEHIAYVAIADPD